MRTDVHQHLWTEPLVEALARRTASPRLRRSGDHWQLDLPAEESCLLPGVPEPPERRAELLRRDGLDRALVALSPALGAESLGAGEAVELLDAFASGLSDAGHGLAPWAAVSLVDPDPAAVDAALEAGAIGLCLPAGALASPTHVLRVGPLLERLEAAGAPLFVHPGPDPWAAPARGSVIPDWWAPMADYVSDMHRAYFAWIAAGVASFPGLRTVFALLAGGAPLHLHRLRARGVRRLADTAQHSTRLFYETSASGPELIRATAAVVGTDQLVHGSDRPVVEPGPVLDELAEALLVANPARLLGHPSTQAHTERFVNLRSRS